MRRLPEKFSNSDDNPVEIHLENKYSFKINIEVIDEIPVQFQKRDFKKKLSVLGSGSRSFTYLLRPVRRGEYFFGKLHLFSSTKLGMAKRRSSWEDRQMVKVYPSLIQMKKYALLTIDNRIPAPGLKKIRKIGHTMEFEQIKDYVHGDDIRTINWKATAKHGEFMVNQFQDERSQPVYSIIDTGRTMKMPFSQMSLLDYAINSSLAFSNIAIKKKDRVGLMTFSEKGGKMISPNSKASHLNILLEQLYNTETEFLDTDFALLYAEIKRKITQRSLLMLYTNFEHISGLQRQLPFLKAIAKKHLLVVIFFENTELEAMVNTPADSIPEIFDQVVAEQLSFEKRLMVKELQKHGIQTILTPPEDLSINTINKYLEIKRRGIL